MKFLCTGDWHIDNNRPQRRVDNYWNTVKNKVSFIINLAKEQNAVILQAGDFFNSSKANDFIKRYMIWKLRRADKTVLTVFGQHDLRYHSSDVKNTPLGVLQAADAVCVLDFDPIEYTDVSIYGASWYEDIPKIVDNQVINILVTHRMIIENKKLWDGQENATFGNILLKTSGYDLIVSGDNHLHFTLGSQGRHLVNPGSLLRTKIDQVGHTPIVYIYDTKDKSLTPHEVPHETFLPKVFDMKTYEKEKERNEKLDAFVERMTQDVELEGLDFIKNMDTFVGTIEDIDDLTLDVIEEVMS